MIIPKITLYNNYKTIRLYKTLVNNKYFENGLCVCNLVCLLGRNMQYVNKHHAQQIINTLEITYHSGMNYPLISQHKINLLM